MADNILKVRMEGDISDLQAKLNKANALQKQYEKNINSVQTAIRKTTQQSLNYERQIENLNKELRQGTLTEQQFEKQNNDLTKSYQRSQNEIKDLQRELDRLQREYKQTQSSSKRLNSSVNDFPKSAKTYTKATGKMQKGTVNATAAATSFGQVLQDAPYGIQGVANNIQQLTAQFGYLQKNAGGSKNALKALLASFTGPAGMLIAVSAVTAGMTALANSGVKLTDVIRLISGQSSKAAKAQRELAESYREGAADARSQVQTVIALVDVLQDENSTRDQQLRAYNKINDLNPELLRGLNLQQAATADLTDEIDKLTQSLVRQAKIQGVQDTIAKKYEEIAEKANQAGIDTASFGDILKSLVTGSDGTFLVDLQVAGFKTASEDIKELEKEAEGLQGLLRNLIEEDIIEEGAFTETSQSLKEANKEARDLVKTISTLSARDAEDLNIPDITAPTGIQVPIEIPQEDLDKYYSQLETAETLTKLFSDSISASMGALASNLSEQLSTGNDVIDAFVSTLIQGLSKIISSFISSQIQQKIFGQIQIQTQRGISTANAITAATSQAAALGPAGFVALPGLIGGAIAQVQGAFASAQTFNDGGIVGGGSFTGDRVPIFANSGEMILNSMQQRQLFSQLNGGYSAFNSGEIKVVVEGQVSGDKINLVSSRADNIRNRRN